VKVGKGEAGKTQRIGRGSVGRHIRQL